VLTGPRVTAVDVPESPGAELAAVSGEGSFEPSELVVPDLATDQAREARARANGQSAAISDSGRNQPG
jgi:hypothetical protein